MVADSDAFVEKFLAGEPDSNASNEHSSLVANLVEGPVKDAQLIAVESMAITAINGLTVAIDSHAETKEKKCRKKIADTVTFFAQNVFDIKQTDIHPVVWSELKRHHDAEALP